MFDILLFHAKTGEQVRSLRHASYTMGLEFSPDGRLLGWSEPDGYYFIDLGRKPENKD